MPFVARRANPLSISGTGTHFTALNGTLLTAIEFLINCVDLNIPNNPTVLLTASCGFVLFARTTSTTPTKEGKKDNEGKALLRIYINTQRYSEYNISKCRSIQHEDAQKLASSLQRILLYNPNTNNLLQQ